MKELYARIKKQIENDNKKKHEEKELANIKWALKEIYYARKNFDMVTGNDNVELAIYELNVAEKRYQNLLKEAKKSGIVFGNKGEKVKDEFNIMIDECIS